MGTYFDEEPDDGEASTPGISSDEVVAGGRLGVPVVFGSSTPSVAVADRGVPVSVYCPSVTLIVVVSVVEAVVGDAAAEVGGDSVGDSVGSWKLDSVVESDDETTEADELLAVTAEDVIPAADVVDDETALEEDEDEGLPAPMTLITSARNQ